MPNITLAEPPFLSIQGEGQRIGRPTIFVRTYVCNLRCAHCDSKNTWGTGKFNDTQYKYDLSTFLAFLKKIPGCREICITGGEPMLEGNGQFFKEFQWEMHNSGYELTIETAATVYNTKMIKAPMNLWSISPKYSCQMTGYVDWVNYYVLNAMVKKIDPKKMELKLLISNPRDVSSAKTMINKLDKDVFNKLLEERVPVIVQPDCEANWTQESYHKSLEAQFKTTAKKIPTTSEYMSILKGITSTLMGDPLLKQFNLQILPQYHKLLGVV
jgi:organic radical activating enzyme